MFALSFALLAHMPTLVVAAGPQHAALVVDGNTGAVLHAESADEPRYPASLTKMMTLYLAFEAIEQGRASYTTRLKISQEAAYQPPTKLDLDPGETIQLIDAMKALITKSANDMAVAIAEHLAGSEARFAQVMTAKAIALGMTRTTFRNASGLPDAAQLTTARDMVTLALRLQDDFPVHYKLFSMRTFSYDGTNHRNHNNLLFRFQGTEGIKTGYTRASGFNLVASVKRDGRHIVGAIFGGTTAGTRDNTMQFLLSRALIKASGVRTRQSAPVLVAQAKPVERSPARQAERPAATQRLAVALPAVENARQTAPVPRPEAVSVPRPVMVPVRQRNPDREPAATAPSQLAPPSPTPAVRPQLAAVRPTLVAAARVSPIGAADAPAQAAGPIKGTPPGTLQQQATLLAVPQPVSAQRPSSGFAPGPAGLRGPIAAADPAAPAFEIQVGAYGSVIEADRALDQVRSAASDMLQSRLGRAVAVQKEARQVFRARFIGFDSRSAAATCLELRRRQIDCFVMKTE